MTELASQLLLLACSIFILLAGVGALRMPDLYMRLSTVTKGATMGLGLILAGVLIELFSGPVLVKVVAVLAFTFVTSPVAAHMISRAAYFQGISLWEGTQVDELKGQYEGRRHRLASPPLEDTLASGVFHEVEDRRDPEQ